MASDTNSSKSSSSSEKCKKRKKLKRKSEKKKRTKMAKKEKRHKDKRHDRREKHRDRHDDIPIIIGNQNEKVQSEDTFGPALPPHLLKNISKVDHALIGPVLPSNLLNQTENLVALKSKCNENSNICSDDREDDVMDFAFGPLPVPVDAEGKAKMNATQIELEQRALEIKLAAIEGGVGQSIEAKAREEWMLELPAVGLKGGLAALSNMKRTFHHGKERPDFSDRSSWTKTPQDATNPTASTSKSANTADALKLSAEAAYERQRDQEQDRLAKKHIRDESLVAIHQKKLRKEQRKREKELAATGAKPERRPFSRDVDLKLNKIDKNQTKQIVDKAKILNTKFASGKTKYL